jgi:iron complex outermembrane recepter protein
VRADRVRFQVKDRLITASNPDDSGFRTLGAVSPVAGIVARVLPLQSVYANVSTAFETPTATELGNHEDGTAGINPDLDPQRSQTLETGAKGWIGTLLRYDAALFTTRVRDELVPFDIPNGNGRRYFRNAGRTRRRGAELGAELNTEFVSLQTSYTYSNFKFVEYTSAGTDLSGNIIPGIPRHRLQTAFRLSRGSSFGLIENEVAGKAFADDQNTFKAPGYAVSSVRLGTKIGNSRGNGSLVLGVQNIFNRTYASSIVVNAARGKYFEPAPLRTIFVGLSVGARAGR